MKDEQLLGPIVLDPKVMVGKAVIRGTRLTVDSILNLLFRSFEKVFAMILVV
jgi:uncharacterized protein (DUF433 family)